MLPNYMLNNMGYGYMPFNFMGMNTFNFNELSTPNYSSRNTGYGYTPYSFMGMNTGFNFGIFNMPMPLKFDMASYSNSTFGNFVPNFSFNSKSFFDNATNTFASASPESPADSEDDATETVQNTGVTPSAETPTTEYASNAETAHTGVNSDASSTATTQENAELPSETINLTEEERTMLDNNSKKEAAKIKSDEQGTMLGCLAGSAVFMSGTIAKGTQVNKNLNATNMFFEYDNAAKKAKHINLYKQAPTVMEEAQGAMAKASRKYKRDLRRAAGNSAEIRKLTKDFNDLKNMMQTALNTGKPDDVAKATAKLKGANKVKNTKIRKAWRNLKGEETIRSRYSAAKKVNTTKIKPVYGNKFFKNFGGKSGLVVGTAMTAEMLFLSKDKIKEAYSYDKKTGRKQLGQSVTEAALPILSYSVGDAIGKTATKAVLKKAATKIAAKLASKGACKALGAAIGSVVPGLGTVAGLLIGTVLEFALSKWVIPAVFGKNDVAKAAEIENRDDEARMRELSVKAFTDENAISEEELALINKYPNFCSNELGYMYELYIRKCNGEELSQEEINLLNSNPEFCDQMKIRLEEQARLEQVA